MILDVDTGIDDAMAMAIAYALVTPACDLIGIVCSYGNVKAYQAAQNTLALLQLLHHPEIPVYIRTYSFISYFKI